MKRIFRNFSKGLLAIALCLLASEGARPSDYGAARVKPSAPLEEEEGAAILGAAYNAYFGSDWQSAVMLFRKAMSDPQNESDAALYMLISAEMKAMGYKAALSDSDYFLKNYPESKYASLIKYQRGKCLYSLGEFDKAVLALSDFCHQYPSNEMYSSALLWIAECFYSGYNFEQARPLYERVVDDFPKDAKAVDAKYRLDAINQRLREEKLLYLLQQTGESYLSSKENYEKALRRYELESALGLSAQPRAEEAAKDEGAAVQEEKVSAAQESLASLPAAGEEKKPAARESAALAPAASSDYNFIDALARLKKSAAEAQGLLDDDGGSK